MREIEIIGGGLSGLTLGIYLRKLGVTVRVVEAGAYPRHKVCGEFVCGVGEDVLRETGIAEVFAGATHHRDMAWWVGDDPVMREDMAQHALGLSRYRMDAQLATMFRAAGGELLAGRRADQGDAPGRVWAVGKRKRRGKWIGLKVHFQGVAMEGLEMHLGKQGYLGLCGVEGGRVNGCGLFRIDKSVDRANLLQGYLQANGLDALSGRLSAWQPDHASWCATAGFSMGAQQQPGSFCVGDAAFLIPPFSGNGMSMAIESAWLAGPWLAEYAGGQLAWPEAVEAYTAACARHFNKRTCLARGLHPFLLHEFGRQLLKWSAKGGVLPFGLLFKHLRT
jgi:flavin-dependent dehydrogenase